MPITRCTTADLLTLGQISIETFSDTFAIANSPERLSAHLETAYTPQKLRAELNTAGSAFYLLTVDGQPAGYLKLNADTAQTTAQGPDSLEIERLYLRQKRQHRGYGQTLIAFAEARAHALGKHRLWLGVWERNDPANAFYQRLGFQRFSHRPFLLGTGDQTDLLLEKHLTN
ncbi:MAG: GNAT family N-acetyltransferase [Lactobacillus sp.]|jgi:ribosomal protein S18 acetylase RimI-like enzyme|nr:GNAT family N-acetyltransferase [Lactobacillus sp.]MCI2031979.1 GNAT family N-acetyltransferase [Lactobacillus sp.]